MLLEWKNLLQHCFQKHNYEGKNVRGRRIEGLIRVQTNHDQVIFLTNEMTNGLDFGTKIYSLHILMLLTVFWKKDLMQIESPRNVKQHLQNRTLPDEHE